MHFIKGGSGLVTILDDMFGTEGTMDFLKDNFFEVIAEFILEYINISVNISRVLALSYFGV